MNLKTEQRETVIFYGKFDTKRGQSPECVGGSAVYLETSVSHYLHSAYIL